MNLPRERMLEIARTRDGRYDGRFIVGVTSTGVYCLPSCPAREPKPGNVRFFQAEDTARAAGLRPCRRCRPDRFYAGVDVDGAVLDTLTSRIRARPRDFRGLDDVAGRSGLGVTRLNALFRDRLHTTPAAFLARARIAAARDRLAGSDARIADVAYDVGFGSLSAFNARFKRSTGLTPGAYRRLPGSTTFELALPPGYHAGPALRYLGRDPEGPTERVGGGDAVKAVRLGNGGAHLLRMKLEAGRVRCRVDGGRADMRLAHGVAVRLLGLAGDPTGLERRAKRDEAVRRLIRGRRGLRVPLTGDTFEALVWAVVGQQVTIGFAARLRRALIELCGRPVARTAMLAHPGPGDVAKLDYADLTRRRYSRRKAEYLIDAARLVESGALPLDALGAGAAVEAERRLTAVRGIGPWTARYVMMRGAGFGDCVPVGDAGLSTALERFYGTAVRPDAAATERLMRPFAPHRSLATLHLWSSLADAG